MNIWCYWFWEGWKKFYCKFIIIVKIITHIMPDIKGYTKSEVAFGQPLRFLFVKIKSLYLTNSVYIYSLVFKLIKAVMCILR